MEPYRDCTDMFLTRHRMEALLQPSHAASVGSREQGCMNGPQRQQWLQELHVAAIKRKEDPLWDSGDVNMTADVAARLGDFSLSSPQKRIRVSQFKDYGDSVPHNGPPGLSSFANQAAGAWDEREEDMAEEFGEKECKDQSISLDSNVGQQAPILKLPEKRNRDERSLVLYQRPSPPALPASPTVPSAAHTGPAGAAGAGADLLALTAGKPILSVGPGLMEALDLSGMAEEPTVPGAARRIHRTNSCSSISLFSRESTGATSSKGGSGAGTEDAGQSMMEEEESEGSQGSSSGQMAVVPYTTYSFSPSLSPSPSPSTPLTPSFSANSSSIMQFPSGVYQGVPNGVIAALALSPTPSPSPSPSFSPSLFGIGGFQNQIQSQNQNLSFWNLNFAQSNAVHVGLGSTKNSVDVSASNTQNSAVNSDRTGKSSGERRRLPFVHSAPQR